MSSTPTPTTGVPCPREVWAAAREHRRIAITIRPDARSVQPQMANRNDSGGFALAGDITDEPRKVGDAYTTSVSVAFTPDGEVAVAEIEARKRSGEWGPFRAYAHHHYPAPDGGVDGSLRYIGVVTDITIPGLRSDSDGSEVVA